MSDLSVDYNKQYKMPVYDLHCVNEVDLTERPRLIGSHSAAKILYDAFPKGQISLREVFMVALIDRQNHIIGIAEIHRGGTTNTVVDTRLVFMAAIKANAAAIILCHNHPSSNLTPSEADKNITDKLVQAGEILEIPILDHIILAPDGAYYSFADNFDL